MVPETGDPGNYDIGDNEDLENLKYRADYKPGGKLHENTYWG
jgi:hypothetical protein